MMARSTIPDMRLRVDETIFGTPKVVLEQARWEFPYVVWAKIGTFTGGTAHQDAVSYAQSLKGETR